MKADQAVGTTRARNRESVSAIVGSVEETIDALAASQYGVVTRVQLLRASISAETVERRIKAKRLRPLHRGVYLVGPVMPVRAKEMAAVLACGPSAVVSHRSAAILWELLAREDRAPVHITISGGDYRKPGIRIHRTGAMSKSDVTQLERIPITSPARTLLDLACASPRTELERAVAQAIARRLTNRAGLIEMLARYPRRPGARRLRGLLEAGQTAFTRSEAEERFLALIRKAQLPVPEVNVEVCGHEVDFFWRAERFVTEVDGFAYHSSAGTFESDRRRDALLAAAGIRAMRVTWRQLMNEPEALLVRLAQALAR